MIPLLLLIGQIGLYVEEVGEAQPEMVEAITAELSAAIAARTGREIVRAKAPEMAVLRIYAGPTIIRVIVDRIAPDRAPASVTIDLRQNRTLWREAFDRVAVELFPPAPKVEAPPLATPVVEPEKELGVWPFVFAGAAVAALAVGIGFGVKSNATRNEIEQGVLLESEFSPRADRLTSEAIAGNVLIGVGIAAAVATFVSLLQ